MKRTSYTLIIVICLIFIVSCMSIEKKEDMIITSPLIGQWTSTTLPESLLDHLDSMTFIFNQDGTFRAGAYINETGEMDSKEGTFIIKSNIILITYYSKSGSKYEEEFHFTITDAPLLTLEKQDNKEKMVLRKDLLSEE